MKALIFSILLLSACGSYDEPTHEDLRSAPVTTESPEQKQIDDLKKTVLELQGTVSQLNAFTSSPFTTCAASLTPFQQTICQIAQTAVAENNTTFFDSLASISKIFQNQLYGTDCQDTTSAGCPVGGSVTAQLAALSTSTAANTANIATLQSSVTSLQGSMTAITTRLNNFNGSGGSIETVVTGINTSVSTLQSQVAAIQSTLSSSAVWKVLQVCNDIPSSGPVFEVLLEQGDKTQIDAYIQAGSNYGLGVLSQAGVTGTRYIATTLNTGTCQFKVYDLNTSLKICWDKSNRSQTSAGIDTACDFSHNFASPTTNCTCK